MDREEKHKIVSETLPAVASELYRIYKLAELETHIAGTVQVNGEYFQLIFAKIGCEAPDKPHIK